MASIHFSSIFPHLYTSFFRGGGEVYSYGGFLYRFVTLHSDRNCGPFSEPGQYQCVLSSALYFIMFHPRLFEAKRANTIYNRVLPCLDYNSFYKRLYRNSNIGFLLPIAFLKNNRQTNEIRYYNYDYRHYAFLCQ